MLARAPAPDGAEQDRLCGVDETGRRPGRSHDVEGKILASLSQLDSRVRLLERQSEHSDRQACEVSRIVQELRRDQGELLPHLGRLSRLEEQFGLCPAADKADEDMHGGLLCRLDAMEARVAALTESAEELRQQVTEAEDRAGQSFDGDHVRALVESQQSQWVALEAVEELRVRLDKLGASGRAGVSEQGSVGSELRGLRQRVDSMQEAIDEQVMVWVWNAERQLPEAMEKMERLAAESAEHFSRFEEHEVRLNLALAKLGAHEQKVQVYADRVERLPTTSEVRGIWREEVRRQIEDANIDGLQRRVGLLADSVEEISVRLCSRDV